jgi:hypothetical protein
MWCKRLSLNVAVLSTLSLGWTALGIDARAQSFIDPAELAAPATGTFAFSLLSGRPSYKPKDNMVLIVLTEEACKLTVADIDSDGIGSVLFPNKLQPDNRLEAGKVFSIGDRSSPIRLVAGDTETHTVVAQCVTAAGSLVRQTIKVEVQ